MSKNTIVVNLFASPGSGKSTTAAGVFSNLKLSGCDCELVTEYAKDLVWDNRIETLKNQLYVSGKQSYRISRLIGKVDVIITDSPVLLSTHYNRINKRFNTEYFDKLMFEEFSRYSNLNYFISLVKDGYNNNGRLQTYEESNNISVEILEMLKSFKVDFTIVDKSAETILNITNDILNNLRKIENVISY